MPTRDPPHPLDDRLPGSARHPRGLPRCRFWRLRSGVFHQCCRAARLGFRVCGHHGAGFPARERAGRRRSVVSRFTDGTYATLETLAVMALTRREIAPIYLLRLISVRLAGTRSAREWPNG